MVLNNDYEPLLVDIAHYIESHKLSASNTTDNAYLSFIDAIGCAFLALNYPACHNTLGPISQIQNTDGIPVFGTHYKLDPVMAAFSMSSMIRWLDFNDTWLGEEWGHPSDCIGGLLACSCYANRFLNKKYTLHDLLEAMVKSYEIQGLLAQKNAFNRAGIDHVAFLKMGLTGVCTHLLGGSREHILAALSLAVVDGHAMRTYRHLPNTGRRKSWAAADAVKDALFLAFLAKRGEMGYPSCLTTPTWGLYDVYFKGKAFELHRDFGDFVINNILFKVPFSAEYHSITAIECAINLHHNYKDQLNDIKSIEIQTQAAAMRIIVKDGPLTNPASRDHCLQYIVAVGLIYGEVYPHHFEDETVQNPLIDELRSKMSVSENKSFSQDYLDLNKKSCANSIKLIFKDAQESDCIQVDYPLGHPSKRDEARPKIIEKFKTNMTGSQSLLSKHQRDDFIETCLNKETLLNQHVTTFLQNASA